MKNRQSTYTMAPPFDTTSQSMCSTNLCSTGRSTIATKNRGILRLGGRRPAVEARTCWSGPGGSHGLDSRFRQWNRGQKKGER
eukprot:scaffold375_cov378-Prasinococcus_capsulatus_cf.AAC.15